MNLSNVAETVTKLGAPLIGAALGTQAESVIVNLLSSAFGFNGEPEQLSAAIEADPEARVKLAEIESNQKIELQKLIIQSAAADDANTADARENNNKHMANVYFAMFISFIVIASFYACIYWIAAYPQDNNDHDVLYMLFGVAGTAFGAVVNYWLGSSADKNGYKLK